MPSANCLPLRRHVATSRAIRIATFNTTLIQPLAVEGRLDSLQNFFELTLLKIPSLYSLCDLLRGIGTALLLGENLGTITSHLHTAALRRYLQKTNHKTTAKFIAW
jgi:hypothetical protein